MTGEDIPEPMSAITEFLATVRAVFMEFYDIAAGKSGLAGYAVLALLVAGLGILGSIVAMFLLPGKSQKADKKKKSKKKTQ